VCLLLGASALLMFVPGWHSRVVGLGVALPLLFLQYRLAVGERRQGPREAPVG